MAKAPSLLLFPSLVLPVLCRSLLPLTVLLLGLATPGLADVPGIPHHPDFPAAEFPYARVLDGCTDWRRPSGVGEEWGAVSFKSACRQHDLCYHTPGASWGECNQRYHQDLKDACERDLKRARLEKGQLGEPDDDALRLCYEIAGLFYAQVQKPETIHKFQLAQKVQQLYLTYVREVLNGLYEKILKRPATRTELDRVLGALLDGQTVDEVERALKDGATDPELELTSAALEPEEA